MKIKRERMMNVIIIIVAIGLLIYGYSIIAMAKHNIDLAYNYLKFSSDITNFTNQQLKDRNISFQIGLGEATDIGGNFVERPLVEYYIIGQKQIEVGYFISIFSAFILGVYIEKIL